MDLLDAEILAKRIMKHHGLIAKGWKFKFDNARNRLGLCTYNTRTISLSKNMTKAACFDEVEQTIFHEVAHALLPVYDEKRKRIGHGLQWQKLAQEIGYKSKKATSVNPYSVQLAKELANGENKRPLKPSEKNSPLFGMYELGDYVELRNVTGKYDKKKGHIIGWTKKYFHVFLEDSGIRFSAPVGYLIKI